MFPYHYFSEIIIPLDCESFLTLVLSFWAEPFRYEIYKNAIQYISINDAFKFDLVIGYADDNCIFQGEFAYGKGRWSHL